MDQSTGDLADLPLSGLLEQLAASTPAPGGGSATAVACALAAGLVEMAAGFGAPRDAGDDGDEQRATLARTGHRAAELRALALELAELELHSYAPVLEALRLPTAEAGRDQRLRKARTNASAVPLRIAGVGAELAALAAQTARRSSPHLVGDAITAALLAEAACRGAARLVEINLAGDAGDPRLQQGAELARDAAAARETALATGFGDGSR